MGAGGGNHDRRRAVPGAQPPLLLVYLCHHLERHLFETPLTHIWDLGEVLQQAGETFDWPAFWRLCERFGQRKAAQAALHLATACLGIPNPAPPLPAHVQELFPDIVANLGRHPQTPANEPSVDLMLLSAPGTPWRVRWHVLRRQLLPARRALAQGGGGSAGPAAYGALWWTVLTTFLRKRVVRRLSVPSTRARPLRAARLSAWLR